MTASPTFSAQQRRSRGRIALLVAFTFASLAGIGMARGQEGEKKKDHQVRESGQNLELRGHEVYLRIREFETADADGDGQVSRAERTAFLIALAMQSSDAVLREYPTADEDNNGKLDVDEALELVQRARARADIRRGLRLERAGAESGELDEEQLEEMKLAGRRANVELVKNMFTVQEWLLDNMSDEPAVEAVAEYAEMVGKAERAEFRKKNPDADADGDGMVSKEERAAFQQARWSQKIAEIREQIAKMEERLEDADQEPGAIEGLEARLKRLRGAEAEYAGAIDSVGKRRR